ncbi:MAG: DUF1295 domain-containing protein [Candidatus Izemoplasma sp.]|nr:DUF1295 domain-containing protein [Candidatus Izemoplasma sp.]
MGKTQATLLVFFEYGLTMTIGALVFYLWDSLLPIILEVFVIDVLMTALIFMFSLGHNNSSVYDPYWSVMPVFLLVLIEPFWYFETVLQTLIAFSVLLWSLRLTTNWAVRFNGFNEEDFRYVEFREKFNKFYWLISLLAIHLFPTVLVFLGLLPLMILILYGTPQIAFVTLGSIIIVIGVIVSFVADRQLRLHRETHPYKPIKSGLWLFSRHPNYLGELCFWYGIALMSAPIGVAYAIVGIIPMTLLFEFYSIPKMESRTLAKKPGYQNVIDTVPRLLSFPYVVKRVIEQFNPVKKSE